MRHLPVVLHALIQLVPAGETELIQDLNLHLEANRYRAPEICDWGGVAQALFKHLNKREEIPWVAALLAVWTDQPNAQKLIDALPKPTE